MPRRARIGRGDSSALVLVTWLPNRREAKASLAPRSLGRACSTGPAVVFDRYLPVPVAGAGPGIGQAAARW